MQKQPDPTQGWSQTSPRPELRPEFSLDPQGGPDHHPCLIIRSNTRDGLDGAWTKTFPVAGGNHYHFSALYRAAGVSVPRRSIVAKLDWRDALGRSVPAGEPAVQGVLPRMTAMAETEFPAPRAPQPA